MTIRNLTDALTACGLPLPERAAEIVATRDAIRADQGSHRIEQPHEVVDNLTADNAAEYIDRLTRQRVETEMRHVVASQLAATLEATAAKAVAAEADNLIAAYRKRFDAAAKTVAQHAAAFSPDDQAEAVLSRGSQAAAAWAAIKDASTTLDAGLHLWSTLHEQAPTPDAVVATYEGAHWRRVDAAPTFEAGRWHALVTAGYPLRLNTYAETLALIAATPERELRHEYTRSEGFLQTTAVRA